MWCSEEDDDDSARRSWDQGTPPIEKKSTPLRGQRRGTRCGKGHQLSKVRPPLDHERFGHRAIFIVLSQEPASPAEAVVTSLLIEIRSSCSNTGDRQ